MHLCPPAEACRDAFERMSKATVQMCLSTTGFGSQVDLTRAMASPAHAMYAGPSQQQRQRRNQGSRRQTQRRQSRPIPRYDMHLGEYFEDDGNGGRRRVPPPYSTPQTQANPQTQPEYHDASTPSFASDTSRPPYLQRSPMEYYPKYENTVSPPQQPYYYNHSPQQSTTSPGSAATNASHPQLHPTEQDTQPGFSLDFLELDNPGAEGPVPMDADGNVDYSLLNMPSLGPGVGHSVGIDLGFGMAVDFQHDWSENPNYDMLEGYFFGGSGNGGGTGDG